LAEKARLAEEKQRRRFNRMSAILALERGVNLCEQGNVRHGLVWLARALEILPEDAPDLDFAIRFSLAWRPMLGTLLVWDHGKIERTEFPFPAHTSPASLTSPSGKIEVRTVPENATDARF